MYYGENESGTQVTTREAVRRQGVEAFYPIQSKAGFFTEAGFFTHQGGISFTARREFL